jgi:hypothetical protein
LPLTTVRTKLRRIEALSGAVLTEA